MYKYVVFFLLSVGALDAQRAAVVEEQQGVMSDTNAIDPATKLSAQQAVQALGNEVLRSNFKYALDTMYPRFLNREVKKHGGAEKFQKVFAAMPAQLNQMGVTIQSFKAEPAVGHFLLWPKVRPEVKRRIESGQQQKLKEGDVIEHWLVLVPTKQVWLFAGKNGRPARKLQRIGFQIAIAEKVTPGQEKWTFIDGTSVSKQDLKTLFPRLPQNLLLPKINDSEIK